MSENSIQIVVAGASGFIGQALLPALAGKFPGAHITALSRVKRKSDDKNIEWKPCDLFSMKSLEEALPERVDLAIYLVHSMGPTAQLDQGSFADYDLILADNFAKTLSKRGVKHMIYLGGLIPETKELSDHLRSRLEVEEAFSSYQIPLTVFRAGLIMGEEGSSWQILLKLVSRLPIMLCPSWTHTKTTPTALNQVVYAITEAALNPLHVAKVYDLAGCQPLTYIEMMRQTAERLGKGRLFLRVALFTPWLSRLWVSLITNTPRELVYPLIQSLRHPMLARKSHLFPGIDDNRSYQSLLDGVNFNYQSSNPILKFRPAGGTVRSVQRLDLPAGRDALWVKEEYLRWLPKFLNPIPLVTVTQEGDRVAISLFGQVLLELSFSLERSHKDRQLLYIKTGRLVHKENRGRLEFRVVLNRKYVIAAIHDYSPALPWYLYKYTQARLHLWVMRSFGRHLQRLDHQDLRVSSAT